MDYNFKIHNTIADLTEYRLLINDLLDRQKPYGFFYELDWLSTWISELGKGSQFYFILVFKGSVLAGFMPLIICTKKIYGISYRVLDIMGSRQAGWTGILARDGDTHIVQLYTEIIEKYIDGWDIAILQRLRPRDSVVEFFKTFKNTRLDYVYNVMGRVYGIGRYDDFESYIKSRSSKLMKNYRRYRRNIEKTGELRFIAITSGSEQATANLNIIQKIANNSWQGMDSNSIFSQNNKIENLPQFHANIFTSRNERFQSLSFIIFLNDIPVTYRYGFLTGDTYSSYAIEYDQSFRSLAPGVVLHYMCIEYLFNNKIGNIDFGIGDGRHKDEWTDWCDELFTVYIFKRTIKSLIYKYFRKLKLIIKFIVNYFKKPTEK
ncbi:MAG: GNAT family N-acetyltransferase [Gammaproteobacteria bacterium]|nr:GNAT family N-acetyltransferase [Gammaproteobacteria bacterium]